MIKCTNRKRYIVWSIWAVSAISILCSCSSSASANEQSGTEAIAAASADGTVVYNRIVGEDHIDIDTAYEELSGLEFSDADAEAFVQKIADLKKCEGRFIQESESTGNRYTADVSFYLHDGDVYFAMPYSGYSGTITDGLVEKSSDSDYLYESATTGEVYGQEQQFSIHFSEERLHVEWADTCDYVLVRGDGSVEHEQDYRKPFDETDTYQAIVSLVDKLYASTEHQLYYDADSKELNLYMKAPDSTRKYITAEGYKDKIRDSWQALSDSLIELGGKLYTVLHAGNGGEHVNIYMVDAIKDAHAYTSEDYLLWIDNDTVKYDILRDDSSALSKSHDAEVREAPAETTAPVSEQRELVSEGSTSYTVSSGERHALQKASEYLDVMAFSYTGLIEQLEYEGFSHYEAVYGADNCGADWNEQAALKAQEYLDVMSMSKSQLIEQLEYEGFTPQQARYGADIAY